MPSPSSAYDLIRGAMRLINALAPGETPTATEAQDGLAVLNDLLETMSTESLSVWGQADETFPTTPGQAVYTIGPGGNWDTARPIAISDAFCTRDGIDFPVGVWSQEDYNAIALKTQQQGIVERLLYVNDHPLGLVTLYPVPADTITVTITANRILESVPSTATILVYPPGYLLFMKHAMAVLLAPDYGRKIPQDVKDIYNTAKANISRANKPKRFAKFDSALTDGGGAANWQRGY